MARKHGTAKSEAAEIKRMGAKAQANSGRGKVKKGDAVIDGYWLCDVKEYPKGYTVSLETWAKICTDAMKSGNLEPTLNIVLGEAGGPRVRLFVLSEDEFNEYRALRSAAYE
jgi:hypothetical protein